jgi:hypothetical protein
MALGLRSRETRDHVCEPAGLRERRDLARDVNNSHKPSYQSPANFLKRGPADS